MTAETVHCYLLIPSIAWSKLSYDNLQNQNLFNEIKSKLASIYDIYVQHNLIKLWFGLSLFALKQKQKQKSKKEKKKK